MASMVAEIIDCFSGEFKTKPYRVCRSGVSHVRRPRLWWADWDVASCPGAAVAETEHYNKILFEGENHLSSCWCDEGWALCGGEMNALPTFVSCQKFKATPPELAGIGSCDAEALARFPAYQYKLTGGLVETNGSL